MGKVSLLAPGFRFHPTDVELVMYYLKRKVMGKRLCFEHIAEVDIYKFAPWDLPDKSLLKGGDLKWYFFCHVEKKYSCGARMKRATEFGYWKTTGKDRPVRYNEELVGSIKTLIFHIGKAPRGERTNWVMHEYKLEDKNLEEKGVVQNAYVLCMIFEKGGFGPKNSAQYGAPFKEEDWDDDNEVDCVKAGPSTGLPTPTYALPNNCSSSVAIDSIFGGLVSGSCSGLSQTVPAHCKGLTTAGSNDVVKLASGDCDILPEALADNYDDILALLEPFTEDNTLISIEDDKNKDIRHDGNAEAIEATLDIEKDLGNLGHTTGLSEDGFNLDEYFNLSDLE